MHKYATLPNFPLLNGVDFRLVPDWHGYAVSNDGRVWSAFVNRHRIIGKVWRELRRGRSTKQGRLSVTLCRDGLRVTHLVHRLVLQCFVGPCPDGMQACHFPDRDPGNCSIRNIRWDTVAGNAADRAAHGKTCKGEMSPNAKLTDKAVLAIRERHAKGISQVRLAKEFGVSAGLISHVVLRSNWSHI